MGNVDIKGNPIIFEDRIKEVINCIRKFGPISRTDIGKKINISKSTVTRIIEDLLKSGLIRETGALEASSKRKPVGIELNPDAYYCIGINISRSTLRAIIADFSMKVIHKKQVSIKNIHDAQKLLQAISSSIRDLIDDSKIDEKLILGAGIGVPGLVDHAQGIILDFASMHDLVNVKLKEYLESNFEFEVIVDNDARALALGEYWYGYAVGYDNNIFVSCREGIGSGIIVDGKILRGKNNVTGEFGHMIINTFGRKCSCGRYGCIEAYCTTEAIEEMVRDHLKRGRPSMLLEKVEGDIGQVSYALINQCAFEGDVLCLEQLREAANIISIGLANLIAIINPEIVILSGDLFDVNDIFFNMVKEYTREKLFNQPLQDVKFEKRTTNDNLYEIGAAAMVYRNFFGD